MISDPPTPWDRLDVAAEVLGSTSVAIRRDVGLIRESPQWLKEEALAHLDRIARELLDTEAAIRKAVEEADAAGRAAP